MIAVSIDIGNKFTQAAFVQVTGAAALFAHVVTGQEYIALSVIALGIYATADVRQKNNELKTKADG